MNMAEKRKLLDDSRIASQQALVKQLVPTTVKAVKRTIPAGKTLIEQVDQEDMEKTVYNWLRGCGHFTEVKISLAKEPDKLAGASVERRQTWETKSGSNFWERAHGQKSGRQELARLIASILKKERVVFIQAKPDGLFVGKDKTGKFGPVTELTKQMQTDNPELAEVALKTKVPNPDWEPYVEFVPKKARVTRQG